jgi:hypothetical protein
MPGYVHSAENKSNVDFTNHTGNCMNVSPCCWYHLSEQYGMRRLSE